MRKLMVVLAAMWAATYTSFAQEINKIDSTQEGLFIDYEESAKYPGGEEECYKFLAANVKYPAECMEQGIQGRVIVSFVINVDGSISEIKTLRSPHPALSKEAERVVALMPKWKPATQMDKPVRSRFNMPVIFRLNADGPQKTDSLKQDVAANDNEDKVYDVVETNAQFPGGEAECYKFLASQMKYPVKCQQEGIQGRVIVSFVINKDGSIVEVKTIKSPHPALSKEAERIVNLMPKWKPAIQGGKTVRSRYNLPLMFRLK